MFYERKTQKRKTRKKEEKDRKKKEKEINSIFLVFKQNFL